MQIKEKRKKELKQAYIARDRDDDAQMEKKMEKVMPKEELKGSW